MRQGCGPERAWLLLIGALRKKARMFKARRRAQGATNLRKYSGTPDLFSTGRCSKVGPDHVVSKVLVGKRVAPWCTALGGGRVLDGHVQTEARCTCMCGCARDSLKTWCFERGGGRFCARGWRGALQYGAHCGPVVGTREIGAWAG